MRLDGIGLIALSISLLDWEQYVEFAGMDLDEVPGGDDVSDLVRMPDPNADKANAHRGKPLENLLMAKNRKLQDELTNMRVSAGSREVVYSMVHDIDLMRFGPICCSFRAGCT